MLATLSEDEPVASDDEGTVHGGGGDSQAAAADTADALSTLLTDRPLRLPPGFGERFAIGEPLAPENSGLPRMYAVREGCFFLPSAEHLETAIRAKAQGRSG